MPEQRLPGPTPHDPAARGLPPQADVELMVGRVIALAAERALRWLEPDDAADLAQELGYKFWQAWKAEPSRFGCDAIPEEWLSAAVRNGAIDRYDAAQTRSFAAVPADDSRDNLVESGVDVAAQLESFELGRAVADALNALSPRQRQVLYHVHDRGETYAEAAASMNLSKETVKAYLARATQLMRAALLQFDGSRTND